ncbi:hypothetical protein D9Q98_004769 [Chlorella vulgaris]|uniref:Uncharacterized protein n=1 Tax=Chlorella vulgaris TaxID=3077 RepID=A0A9D4TQB4_CHLVU|nr:hypothetical protein D9Q98_004769 [Chlorella vulgaris]
MATEGATTARVEETAEPKSAGLVERVKGALGFGTGPEEGPRGTPAGAGKGAAAGGEATPLSVNPLYEEQAHTTPRKAGAEPLAAPPTPGATALLTPRDGPPAVSAAAPATPAPASVLKQEGTPRFTGAGSEAAPEPAGLSPVEAAAARLEQLGARRGRIGGGQADAGATSAAGAAPAGPEVGTPPEASQGDRVQVDRMPLGSLAPATAGGGMPQLEARPVHETRPMTSAEVAGMKAREHVIQAREREDVMSAKGRELQELHRQAELLEVESQGLLAQASQEKLRRDQMVGQREQFEMVEWRNYADAEQAEKERRRVVSAARPVAVAAEESEMEAMRLRQQAADTQYHAEVLERKAGALLQESQDMTALRAERQANALKLSAQLFEKEQERGEWEQTVSEMTSGNLPRYIEECQAEIGRHAYRIAVLREEIEWAELEMERLHGEGNTWERVLSTKNSEAALLRLRMQQANEEADEAERRSHQAAAEALEPTALAEQKYEEAYRLQEQAAALEAQAQEAQANVLAMVQEAVGPEQVRQEHLREAADAESRAKQLALEAQLVEAKMERRLAEAEVQGETASEYRQQASKVGEEHRAAKLTAEAQRDMAEIYSESEQRHVQQAGALDRVGAQPPSAEAHELMRSQRERFDTPDVQVAPTVPVDMPFVPVEAQPATDTHLDAMLAEAPTPPPIPAPAASTAARTVQQAEGGQRVPVAA